MTDSQFVARQWSGHYRAKDPHMQALLAATGTFSGWDDHEVRND